MTATATSGRISFAAKHPWLARPWGRAVMYGSAVLAGLIAKNAVSRAGGELGLWAHAAFACLIVSWSLIAALPARVEVGTDGVLFRWLGLARFIAFRELDAIESAGRKVVLVRGKRRIYVDPLSPRRRAGLEVNAGALAAPVVLKERHAVVQRAALPRELEEALACGARSPAAWFAFLEDRAARQGGYRVPPPDRAAFMSLASNPAALASARGASAWLLMRSGLEPADRHLLLDTALSSVDPQLKQALTAIAGADRPTLAAAPLLGGIARPGR